MAKKRGRLPIEHILTNSLRNKWTGCHRRFHYRMIAGLEPIVVATALSVGKLYHYGLAAHYLGLRAAQNPGPGQDPCDMGYDDPHSAVDKYLAAYLVELEDLPDQDAAQRAKEDARANGERVHGLLEAYFDFWEGFDQWEILAVEEPMEMRLLTPRGTRSHWRYAGIPDLVVRDREDGRIKIVDHKTTSNTSREGYQAELELDPQSRGYCMLWGVLNDGEEADFIFDVQRSKLPSIPATTVCPKCNNKIKKDPSFNNPDCPTCKGTNVKGITARKDLDTTPKVYRELLAKHPHLDSTDPQHVEALMRLDAKADSWAYRFELSYTAEELEDFHRESYEITREMSEAGYWTRNLGGCFAPGRMCVYRHLCLAEGNSAKAAEARAAFRQVDTTKAPELREAEDAINQDMIPF